MSVGLLFKTNTLSGEKHLKEPSFDRYCDKQKVYVVDITALSFQHCRQVDNQHQLPPAIESIIKKKYISQVTIDYYIDYQHS